MLQNSILNKLASWICLTLLLVTGCSVRNPKLKYSQITSTAVSDVKDYGVYCPSSWDGVTPLPLVVFLHGRGADETCLDRKGVPEILDARIESGEIPPCLILVPDGDNGCWMNYNNGTLKYQDYVLDELIPLVRSQYPVLPGPENTHLMGVSMGAFGAIIMALDRPGEFASISLLSGFMFDANQLVNYIETWSWMGIEDALWPASEFELILRRNHFTRIRKPSDLNGMKLLISVSSNDSMEVIRANELFHEHLTIVGLSHLYLLFSGDYSTHGWTKMLPIALKAQLTNRYIRENEMDVYYHLIRS